MISQFQKRLSECNGVVTVICTIRTGDGSTETRFVNENLVFQEKFGQVLDDDVAHDENNDRIMS